MSVCMYVWICAWMGACGYQCDFFSLALPACCVGVRRLSFFLTYLLIVFGSFYASLFVCVGARLHLSICLLFGSFSLLFLRCLQAPSIAKKGSASRPLLLQRKEESAGCMQKVVWGWTDRDVHERIKGEREIVRELTVELGTLTFVLSLLCLLCVSMGTFPFLSLLVPSSLRLSPVSTPPRVRVRERESACLEQDGRKGERKKETHRATNTPSDPTQTAEDKKKAR
mmetsp:Transcript_29887/g.58623  ORF Transcript_29887/g.58623 Transcript_29887/m.58623 type:complete len:226 (-) Transcript_29887:912-1589(-)